MSPRRVPRWAQRTLIGILLLAGSALVIIPQIEIPHPLVYDPQESAARILKVEQHRRWIITRSYGALSAENIELSEIRERADALPEGLQTTYYDGAAHHQRFDFDDLDAWLQNIEEHIPDENQRFYHDGAVAVIVPAHFVKIMAP